MLRSEATENQITDVHIPATGKLSEESVTASVGSQRPRAGPHALGSFLPKRHNAAILQGGRDKPRSPAAWPQNSLEKV